MKLKARFLDFEAGGKKIIVLNKDDAEILGVKSLDRVIIKKGNKKLTALVDVSKKTVKQGEIFVFEEVKLALDLKEDDLVEVEPAKIPNSLEYIKQRIRGKILSQKEVEEIVKDVVEGNLSDVEIAAFIVALEYMPLSLEEAKYMTLAMVKTGKTLELNKKPILDKHSIGGVAGDKTSLLVVPIIASLGYTIPKTSSRAITSASGSADRAEALMPVNLSLEEMKRVVEKTNGCIVWGGALDLAPADDIFIRIERPLSIDPFLLPSIMAKKKAVNASHMVLDIPTGRGAKIKTIGEAKVLGKKFIELANMLNIKLKAVITRGEEPIGHTIGPNLEAREVLEVLMNRKYVPDMVEKACTIAGTLLELVNPKLDGYKVAMHAIKSGKAEAKLRQIIAEQGGNEKIKPEDLTTSEIYADIISKQEGQVLWLNNAALIQAARYAGSPKFKDCGIYIYKKVGEPVKAGEKLVRIYAKSEARLEKAISIIENEKAIGVGKRYKMLLDKVNGDVIRRTFHLER